MGKRIIKTKNRGFKGVWVPASVWLDENLSIQEMLFLVEIESLDLESGCYASNKYFSEFFGLTNGRCSQIITSLKEKGYISVSFVYGKNKEIEKRVIRVLKKVNTPIKNIKDPIKNIKEGYLENAKENNTSFNNTFNNTNKDILSGKPDDIPYKEILLYLNEKTGKNFKCVEANKKLIRARFSEGFILDDFKKVIDIKTEEWLLTDMEKYLRPATLFQASKFDNYLNQKEKKKVGKYGGEYDNLF